MDVVFMKEFPVLPSVCDAAGALSYPGAFECFMDIATQHADRLGVGLHDLQPRNLFWLTVKTKVVFLCRPRMGENTTLITWPEVPGRLRCMRSYEMRQGNKLLLCAKTEWAVVDTSTQRMVPASEVFPNGDLFRRDTACTEAFTMIPDHFDGINPYAQYTVRSTDIDVGGHMNNAAYLKALFGTFSCKELAEKNIHSVDALFRAPCFEGDELLWQRAETPEGFQIRAACKDKTVFLAAIECEKAA